MRVALVGLPFCGKTTLFTAISGLPRDHLKPVEENLASVKVPEPRLDWLEEIYTPKKRTEATLDFLDLPAGGDGESEHAGLSRHLPILRQADGLVLVLRAFESDSVPTPPGGIDPHRDLKSLREEMLLADLLICDNRVEKIEKGAGKPTKDRDALKHELALLKRCRETLEAERPLRDVIQPGEEERMVRSFGFLTQKPVVVALNIAESQIPNPPTVEDDHGAMVVPACAPIEADIIQMESADRPEFMRGYGILALARDRIIRACYDALGLISFLTAGEEEVRAWSIPANTSAVDAAGKIHTDLARGFIKAETVAYADLRDAGSMREAKARGKVRLEPKHYVVQDGDVMLFKFNV